VQVDTKLLKAKFEKSMPKYNANALVQRTMAERLVRLTVEACGENFAQILELGSGTGLLTEVIAKNLRFEHLTCNDIVAKSRNYIEKIIPEFDFVLGNSAKIKFSKHADLIISNAMFQWFSSLSPVAEHYSHQLNKGGILAFSSFTKENFKEIREITGLSLNYLSSEQICDALKPYYEILAIEESNKILEFSNPLELLGHLKNTGVNSLSSKMTFSQVKVFCEKLGTKPTLTYAPIFIVAKLNKA